MLAMRQLDCEIERLRSLKLRVKLQPFPPVKRSVLEYSKIKLPAAAFGQYLARDCKQYLADCLRYIMTKRILGPIKATDRYF
jgi:hypothetical protein